MIAVLEVHDTTGYPEDSSASTISSATDYWIGLKSVLVGQEDYVIINIANEPYGNVFNANDYINDHKSAITRLRNEGFTHSLMVDAPNWGQDWQYVMRDRANEIFQSDPDKNVIFSIHMYEVFDSQTKVDNYLTAFSSKGLPLIIGEFAATHKQFEVDEGSIMSLASTYNVGYIGWSWNGNGSSFGNIDIVSDWNTAALTTWGEILVNGTNGIRATSQLATVFNAGNSGGDDNGNTDNNGYLICASASSDPDGDGWGWENNQSCVVESETDGDTGNNGGDTGNNGDDTGSSDSNGNPICASASSDPDGDGWGWENNQSCKVEALNVYPPCASTSSDPDGDGWGWENNQSCVVR